MNLKSGDYGENVLKGDQYLMELKLSYSIPVWMAHMLSELEIYPVSFSKYGNIYTKILLTDIQNEAPQLIKAY